ncbi:MAG: MFS transporter [Acetobacteraceae bacterium]|nr:MFS transporter [Acetobacteraceae bacterium]
MDIEYPDGLPPALRRRAMVTLGLAVGISVLGTTLPNIALPSIARDLGVSPAESIWVVNAFQIAMTVTLLPLASLGDSYGYRRFYLGGLIVFALASLGCVFATTLPMLTLGRVFQGLGCAGITSVNSALVRQIFPRALLGQGVGFNALVVSTSLALGPTISAGILAVADWPWLFAVSVPVALLSLAMLRALPNVPGSGHRFDWISAVLNGLTFGLFVAGLDGLGHGQSRGLAVAELVVALLIGVVFVRRQAHLKAPMLPVDLFRIKIFSLSVATAICCYIAQTSAYVALPFLFQSRGATPIDIGLLITPWPLAGALMAPVSGYLSDRFPAGLLGGIGLGAMAAGLLAVAMLGSDPVWWDVAWRMALTGAGFSMFQSPNNRLLISAVPRERSGAGSGVISTSRLLGQSIGAALVAVIFGLTEARGVDAGATAVLLMGVGFAVVAMGLSWARVMR